MYRLEIGLDLQKRLKKKKGLPPKNVVDSIFGEMRAIANSAETFPHKYLKRELKGFCKHTWGGFRLIYKLYKDRCILVLIKIDSRDEVYK